MMSSSSVQAVQKLKGCYHQISRQVKYQRNAHLSYRKFELKNVTISLLFILATIYYVHLYRTTKEGLGFKKRQLVVRAAKPYKSLPLTRKRLAKFLRTENNKFAVANMSHSIHDESLQKKTQTKMNKSASAPLKRRPIHTEANSKADVIIDPVQKKIDKVEKKAKGLTFGQLSTSRGTEEATSLVNDFDLHKQIQMKQSLEPVVNQLKQSDSPRHSNQTKDSPKTFPVNHSDSVLTNTSKITDGAMKSF